MPSDLSRTLWPVVEAFNQLQVPYALGGSVASSAHGIARATIDADIVARIEARHIDAFADLLRNDYYLDENAIRAAIDSCSSFNLICFETSIKIDVFVMKQRPYDQQAFPRRSPQPLSDDPEDKGVFMASPEDVILNKLEWYRMGDEISERQWHDVLGVLRVQGSGLDHVYMKQWAAELGVSDLLERAIGESGQE